MYKLFQSKVLIPWNTIDKVAVPNVDISDTFFNFQEVPTNNINFKQWNTATIIVDTKDITYFKLIREGGKTTYWYVNKVLRVLNQGFELEIKLDMWLTYSKDVFKKIIELDKKPIIDRVFLSLNMLYEDYDLRQLIYYAFYNDDELLDETSYQFKEPKPVTSQLYVKYGDDLVDARLNIKAGTNTFIIDQNSNDEILGLGYYMVMLKSSEGQFDCYPITSNIHNPSVTDLKYIFNNSINRLITVVARRNFAGGGSWYEENSFQGIFRGPILVKARNAQGHLEFNALVDGTSSTVRPTYLCTSFNSFNPLDVTFPKPFIDIRGNLIDTYIYYSDIHYWGSGIKFRKYFSMSEKHIAKKDNRWYLNFKCSFMGGFILSPTPITSLLKETEMISFGETLPSPTPEYYNTIKQIQTTYDTGLANAIVGGIQAVPSAIGKAGANPLWGITSLASSVGTLGKDIHSLNQQYKMAQWGNKGKYLTTTNSNYFDSQRWYEILNKTDATKLLATSDKQGSYLENSFIYYELTDNQKEAIKYTLTHYGFQVNNSLPIKKWWELILPQDKLIPIKFDDGWLTNNINSLGFNFNIEEQQEIINQLSSGIRINMEWR